jgi:acetate kinase
MNRSILALNVGSASLKAASYVISRGRLVHETGRALADELPGQSARELGSNLDAVVARLDALHAPDFIVHRIVHGGDRPSPLELTSTVLDELDELSPLAPMHQPPALTLARAAMKRWPKARHYGAFDTSWHLSMPERYRLLPLPMNLHAQGVRRYGFHGLAFQSAMRQLVSIAPERASGRLVLAHLGGGSSLCAVHDKHCVNTTMGMTPLGGIPMSTRPGSLDPGVVLHLQRSLGISPPDLDRLLWKESGLKGLSGESGDMRQLLASSSESAHRAVDVYVAGVVQGVAAMASCIGGIDALAFSGGIGLHAAPIRASVVGALGWLGLAIDDGLNQESAADVTHPSASLRTFVLPVDEELEMADAVSGLVG